MGIRWLRCFALRKRLSICKKSKGVSMPLTPYYEHAGITIYHGDCLEILPQLGPVDAVVTDPPYGMGWDTADLFRKGNNRARRRPGRNYNKPVHGDHQPFDPSPWLDFGQVVLWGANHYAARLPVGATLVWIKRLDHAFGSFLSDAEIAWKKGGCGVYCFRDLSMNAITNQRAHPTQKPLRLMRWLDARRGRPPMSSTRRFPCGAARASRLPVRTRVAGALRGCRPHSSTKPEAGKADPRRIGRRREKPAKRDRS